MNLADHSTERLESPHALRYSTGGEPVKQDREAESAARITRNDIKRGVSQPDAAAKLTRNQNVKA